MGRPRCVPLFGSSKKTAPREFISIPRGAVGLILLESELARKLPSRANRSIHRRVLNWHVSRRNEPCPNHHVVAENGLLFENLEERRVLATVHWNVDADGFGDLASNWLDDTGTRIRQQHS
jgi:hypothetical protein